MTNGIRANDSRRILSHRCFDSDFPNDPALHNQYTRMEPGFMALSIYCAQMASKWSCVLNSRPRQLKDMSVEVYYDQFFTWKKKLEELNYIGDEESYIDDFLFGLKMDLAVGVWRYKWKPLTLYGAFRRAEIEETMISGKEFSTTSIEMPSQYPSEYELEFPMLEASLSTTSFEVTVKGQGNDDPKSAITTENPVVEVLQDDEWLELEENAGSIFGELAVQNVARKVFAEMSEPILKEDLLGSEGAKIVHYMFDEMPHPESVNSAEFLGAVDISDENIDDVLDAPNVVATKEGVLENEAVQTFENLIDPFQANSSPTGLLSSLMTNISSAPYLIEYEAFSPVFEELIWLFEEDEQSSPLTPEGVNDAHFLFNDMPILPSNEQTIAYVNKEHLMFLFVGRPNSTGYIMGTRCDKLIKSAPTIIFIAPKTRNQMVDVSINPGLNDDFWFSQLPSFIFDPGISSRLYKGCGFTKPNGEKHNFDKMPNNLNVELLVGKVLMFVFDPGPCAIFVTILEDKDVFEGVRNRIISMDTILDVVGYGPVAACNSKNPTMMGFEMSMRVIMYHASTLNVHHTWNELRGPKQKKLVLNLSTILYATVYAMTNSGFLLLVDYKFWKHKFDEMTLPYPAGLQFPYLWHLTAGNEGNDCHSTKIRGLDIHQLFDEGPLKLSLEQIEENVDNKYIIQRIQLGKLSFATKINGLEIVCYMFDEIPALFSVKHDNGIDGHEELELPTFNLLRMSGYDFFDSNGVKQDFDKTLNDSTIELGVGKVLVLRSSRACIFTGFGGLGFKNRVAGDAMGTLEYSVFAMVILVLVISKNFVWDPGVFLSRTSVSEGENNEYLTELWKWSWTPRELLSCWKLFEKNQRHSMVAKAVRELKAIASRAFYAKWKQINPWRREWTLG